MNNLSNILCQAHYQLVLPAQVDGPTSIWIKVFHEDQLYYFPLIQVWGSKGEYLTKYFYGFISWEELQEKNR